jgi:hypothetical protein
MPDSGALFVPYYILSVNYVPPGPGSFVQYGTGSSVGTTTSTTASWRDDHSVSRSSSFSFGGVTLGGFSVSFEDVWAGSDTFAKDVLEKTTTDLRMYGPGSDEINHDWDQILLVLNPEVDGLVYPDRIRWSMNLTNTIPQAVLVGWLKGTITDPPFDSVRATLERYGVTEADYPQILSADPFAYDPPGASTPDPARFALIRTWYYEPLRDTINFTTNNNYTSTITDIRTVSYTEGVTATWGPLFMQLKVSNQFTWTNESKNVNTVATSDTETLFVEMPSFQYSGPTVLYVYVDKIYKTFMVSFVRY